MGLSGEGLMAFQWLLITLTILLGAARLHLRLKYIQVGFVLGDLFIIISFVLITGLTILDTYLYTLGIWDKGFSFDAIQLDLSLNYPVVIPKAYSAAQYPWYLAQYLNKGILVALYYDIFARQIGKIRTSLHILTFFCISGFITSVCVNLFYCEWGCDWSTTAPCSDQCNSVADIVGWVLHFVADVWVFIFPLVLISQLQMSKAQKISASITFCLGLINIGITLARGMIVHFSVGPPPKLATAEAILIADSHTALFIAILPSLRPYLQILKINKVWQQAGKSQSYDVPSTIRKETVFSQHGSHVEDAIHHTRGSS